MTFNSYETPVAGVSVDRGNRKSIMVGMDALRGTVVVLVAIAALVGWTEIWMVFAAGIVIGVAAAAFNPNVH